MLAVWKISAVILLLPLKALGSSQGVLSRGSPINIPHGTDLSQYNSPNAATTIRGDDFSVFYHPAFPQSRFRIKKHEDFCEKDTRAYTGYIDVTPTRHLFFYFFESRNDPAHDDILMLISGGPGCSGGGSAFALMGPCVVHDPKGGLNATRPNEFSWNNNKNFLFLDQPIGVGYSYSNTGETVIDTPESSKDVLTFVHLFFEVFSDFKGRPFHMTGGSYSGRSAPVFLADMYDFNALAPKKGLSPINIRSLSIGNGMADLKTLLPAWYEKQCAKSSVPPVQSISTCVKMKQALTRCEDLIQKECVYRMDSISCGAAVEFCVNQLLVPFTSLGVSSYDLTKKCDTLDCYPTSGYVAEWASRNSTRKRLGVDDDAPGFAYCSEQVVVDFWGHLDPIMPTTPYIANLLERGIPVLNFAGDLDWACNDIGNQKWMAELEWSGQEAYNAAPLRDWAVEIDGESTVAGKTRSAGGLTWASVYGAGHMSSYDKPAQTLAMMQRWLSGSEL